MMIKKESKKMMIMYMGQGRRFLSTSTRPFGFGWWDHVKPAAKDPLSSITEAFLADPFPNKINLGGVSYRDNEGKPIALQCVLDAEAKIARREFLESSSSTSSSKFVFESMKLAYGNNSEVVRDGKFAGIQVFSGTTACRLFAELQRRFHPESRIYLPDPTWPNHHKIWRDAQIPVKSFHYYNPFTKSLNFSALVDDVKNAPDGSFFLLHPCAHNPTGVDPNEEQWREISNQFKAKNHFPFFDMAYQGLASGDLDRDAQAIRIFLEDGHLIGCAQSFAKNMGLYGERVACLSVMCADKKQATAVRSQLQQISSAMCSSPAPHGIFLVSTILSDPDLKALWEKELKVMVNRIQMMRTTLRRSIENMVSPLNWEHITNQVGIFCLTGLTPDQVKHLQKLYHIYMTHDGRMSMAGVSTSNVQYLANALHQVTKFDQEALGICNMGH